MRESKKISIDEAKSRTAQLGISDDKFEEEISDKQNEFFTQLHNGIVFSWEKQPKGENKLMGRLPNGKIVFLDRSENSEKVKEGIPYICLIYEPDELNGKPGRVAFAKIVSEEYVPRIIVQPSNMVSVIYRKDNGEVRRKLISDCNNFPERIVVAVKELKEQGFPEATIKFIDNERRDR